MISNQKEPDDTLEQVKIPEMTHGYFQAMLFGKPVIDAAYNKVASIV
jgi:hypothetical protein